MSDNGKKLLLKPAIVIGLGGTGNQVVRRMKKLVKDHYGEAPVLLNFLVVDTDEATFVDQNWAQWAPLTPLEKVPLYDPQVPFSDVRANPQSYPEIHEWLQPDLDVSTLDAQKGAEQVRMRGRVAFYKSFDFFARRIGHFFGECEQIQTKLDALEAFDYSVDSDPVVYVISSVCGGQGAGAFIDVAVALRALGDRFSGLNIIGLLTLPSVYEERIPTDNWSLVCANTHAAMKELDYLMHTVPAKRTQFHFPAPIGRTITPQTAIFNVCYLIDIAHQRGRLNSDEEVFDQIATQLFLELGTPFGARSDSIRVNLATVAGLQRDKAYNTGRRYSGFGNHTITFDREKIVQLASLQSTYIVVHDSMLGVQLNAQQMDQTVDDFVARHRVNESDTDELVNWLIKPGEVTQEQITHAWAQARPVHRAFADQLWELADAFWTRRTAELRNQAEQRARRKLDGAEDEKSMLADIKTTVDVAVRHKGVEGALNVVSALLARLRAYQQLMQAEQTDSAASAQRAYHQAESARDELISIAEQIEELQDKQQRVSFFSKIWQTVGYAITYAITLGLHKRAELPPEERSREVQELEFHAHEQRLAFVARCNEAIDRRLAAEARAVAGTLYADCIALLADLQSQLLPLEPLLKNASDTLRAEWENQNATVKRARFIDNNTMRRDVTADYVNQYHQIHAPNAIQEVTKWLLPSTQPAVETLAGHTDIKEIRQRFYDLYAGDILLHKDRDSLAEMIESVHTRGQGGGLTDRIQEALQFCLPFWNIRIPGNQHPTEVLLVGLEKADRGVERFLGDYRAAQRAPVYPEIVPTGQDSTILISRIAHGASYYWHVDDEKFCREYWETEQRGVFPLHLNEEWRRLPEPIPDPSREERRYFALALAFEFIAVRGAAYYFDPERQFSLVGSSRQPTPDWKTIPLLTADVAPTGANPPKMPGADVMVDDDNRTEAMQRFIVTEDWVEGVRDQLNEIHGREGRVVVRSQIERYCNEVMHPAIKTLDVHDPVRHQLEVELQALDDVLEDLSRPTGALAAAR